MKLSSEKLYSIATFLLLYYCYLNSVRKIMIPMSSVVVPLILAIVLYITIYVGKGRIILKDKTDKAVCFSWLIIAVFIFVHNSSLIDNLLYGGMIQLYVMISFMLFSTQYNEWVQKWIKWTKIYVIIHAVATIIFYYNSNLYSQFVNLMFSGEVHTAALRYYRYGYMSGLSSHFSSNGMILGVGILFYVQEVILTLSEKGRSYKNIRIFIFNLFAALLVLYALILSSKRSPLLAAFVAICATYIIYKRKNVGRRMAVLFAAIVLIFSLYMVLSQVIPGLTTIVDKTEMLEESDAGILNGRSGLWALAIKMFNHNPIIGLGYGSYGDYASVNGAITTSAHNYYLQIMSELGIVGLILYMIVFAGSIILAVKTLQLFTQTIKTRHYEKILALSISLEIQIFVIIYSITATTMMYYYIMIPYFIACSVPRALKISDN